MKYKVVFVPINSLPVVQDIDLESLSAVATEINKDMKTLFPLFVFDMEADKAYRVVSGEDGYFLTDDAEELLGIATPPEAFNRMGD